MRPVFGWGSGMKQRLAWLIVCCLIIGGSASAQTFCDQTAGRVEQRTYDSTALAAPMRYSIYLPPCYDQWDVQFPILYLLHGSNSDDTHWLNLGLAEQMDRAILGGILPPFIVALPYGDWIANENQFGNPSWGNILLDEFIPTVENTYRVDARRETRAIGGISRGGFWAFNLALRHPELFSALGGHSAFFDEFHAPPEQNPLNLVMDAPNIDTLRLWLDRGRDDYAQANLDLIDQRLTENAIPHTYVIYPQGEHNDTYWASHLLEYLQFYAQEWETPTPPAEYEPQPLYLLLPAVAFPSLQANISSSALASVAAGEYDANLVLSESAATALTTYNLPLSAQQRIVADGDLYDVLWRERDVYTLLPFEQLTVQYRVLLVDELHPLDHDLATYPFAFTSESSNYDPSQLTRLLLSGVTALTRDVIPALDANGVAWAANGIHPYVQRADFFHTSNEVSFAPRCPSSDEPVLGAFCSRDPHFALFPYLGVDIVELTGNHNNDYGYGAYRRTLRMFEEVGIATIGGGETLEAARTPYIIDHNGNTIAMLACNWNGPYYALVEENPDAAGGVRPGAAYCEWDWLREAVPALAAQYDVVVVTVQYAEYEQYTPIDRQINDYRQLADLGADIVVGTQAHKPQTFEFYNADTGETVMLHYGMGNLFFDQPFWGNMRFFMDQLFIYQGRLLTVDLFTGIIEDNARPRPMTPEERENFLHFMFIQQNGF
jgi:enterochelin esterase-like enzyme